MSRGGDGQSLIFRRMDSTTGEVQATWTVPGLPSGFANLVFSPDLMNMFFSRKDEATPCQGTPCTYIMLARDLATGRDREVFRIAGYPRLASISDDGGEMAFAVWDGSTALLMVAPTAGGPPREIYRAPADVSLAGSFTGITWTQDGGHVLAFRRLPDGGGEVWSLPTKGGSPEKSPLHVRPSEQPVVSPDGTRVAFVAGNNKSEVWVMTGLFQDAKLAAAR